MYIYIKCSDIMILTVQKYFNIKKQFIFNEWRCDFSTFFEVSFVIYKFFENSSNFFSADNDIC